MDRRGCGVFAIALAVGACGGEAQTAEAPAKSAPAPAPAKPADCEPIDLSGRTAALDVASLHDPVAKLVLTAADGDDGGCPSGFAGVQAKLRRTDAEGCVTDMFSEVQSILISERAQLRRTAQGVAEGCDPAPLAAFRAITLRRCGGRPAHGLMMATTGYTTSGGELPEAVELIGFDEEAGVFNYYATQGGKWAFFGSSIDLLQGEGEQGVRLCAKCHGGGGLVVKELRSPWLYWEGRDTLPGVQQILSAHPDLGSRARGQVLDLRPAGKELEEAIDSGNAVWARTRVEHLRARGTLAQLLRPLFCSVEFQINAAAQSVTAPSSSDEEAGALLIDAAVLVDPALELAGRVAVPVSAYHAAIKASGQRVETSCGARLVDDQGRPVLDTAFDLAYPQRASADVEHVAQLIDQGVIDGDLARAVLLVDFTRPVFSPERCALLDHVPELPPAKRTPAEIRRALTHALAGVTGESPAALRNALTRGPDRGRAERFIAACASRPAPALVTDVLREVSWRRAEARKRAILELREMLPVDDLDHAAGGRLSPVTCAYASHATSQGQPTKKPP